MVGNVVARPGGRYLVLEPIASGGMATVHLGRYIGSDGSSRAVAIKKLHGHFARDPEFVSMLFDEARLSGRIRHPNVVRTLDIVQHGEDVFLVMEHVLGDSLASLVRAWGRPVPPAIAVAIAVGLLDGLHAAHETAGDDGGPLAIVHRDVSPQNVIVSTDGMTRVLDFGVAKARGRIRTTTDGSVRGKPAYMAPEQVVGEIVDRRTDVFAAAIVLWEMLTGRRLFEGETQAQVIYRVLESTIEPPSAYERTLPPELDAIVLRGLERSAGGRFATASDMAGALRASMPLAPPHEVAAWVMRTAGPGLASRASRVAALSHAGDVATMVLDRSAARPPEPMVELEATAIVSSSTAVLSTRAPTTAGGSAGAANGSRWLAVAIAALVALGIGAGGVLKRSAHGSSARLPDRASSSPSAALSVPDPGIVAEAPDTGAAVLSSPPPPPPRRADEGLASTKPAASRPRPARPAKPDCRVPWTTDADGFRTPRPECL